MSLRDALRRSPRECRGRFSPAVRGQARRLGGLLLRVAQGRRALDVVGAVAGRGNAVLVRLHRPGQRPGQCREGGVRGVEVAAGSKKVAGWSR